MSPDPSRLSGERKLSTENTYVTATIIVHPENDDDDISYEGYQVLPQDLNESNVESQDVDSQDCNSEEEEEEEGEENNGNCPESSSSSTFDQAVKIELTELWNSSFDRLTDIAMDSRKEEEIKNAMAGFKLPSSSIPPWAKDIPEEQWKQQILSRISTLNKT